VPHIEPGGRPAATAKDGEMAGRRTAAHHPVRRMLQRIEGGHPHRQAPELSMDPRARPPAPPAPSDCIVDAAIYEEGKRVATLTNLDGTYQRLRAQPDQMAWIGLYRPANGQLVAAAEEFGLHELAVEDAIVAHQRPKLERYGTTLFIVLRAARYLDEAEAVEFGEIHLFAGPNFILTVRHSRAPDLAAVRRRLEHEPGLLKHGPEAVLYAILDRVVDGYAPVVAGLQNDIDEIETEVFRGDPNVSRRIYELSREVIEFQRATHPLLEVLGGLMAGFAKYGTDEELQRYLRDVVDHATTAAERVDGFRQMLTNILAVNATLVSQAQNEEMKRLTEASYTQNEEIKKISAWAAILFAPTLIGTVYGMNFTHMPELGWVAGYPFALLLMAVTCLVLFGVFRRRGWL
jgi:magnesium transporter